MLYGSGLLALVELGLLVYCVLDILRTPQTEVRNLPRLLWLLLVVVVPIVGSIAWLVAGRPRQPSSSAPGRGRGVPAQPPWPARAAASSPDDDEAFLRSLRERAEQQRRAERERRAREQD